MNTARATARAGAAERIELARIEPQRWANGAGLTREIARSELTGNAATGNAAAGTATTGSAAAAGLAFDWRISIAEVARDAPFSAFPGIDRCIVLLAGAGMRLASRDGRIDHRLAEPLVPFRFAGEARIDATVLEGRCSDLNVMTRRGACTSEVVCHRAAAELPSAADITLLWCQAGTWRVAASGPDADGGRGEAHTLAPSQGLLWRAPPGRLGMRPLASAAPAALLVVRLCHDPAR